MPFTFAHPAIILPLAKLSARYFSLTALVVGSIVPDFEYFIRLKVYSVYSHTLAGLFYFDLPVGHLIYLVFIQLVRIPFIIHLPKCIHQRLNDPFRSKNFFVVMSSTLIGAISHLLWDSVTHETGYAVQHMDLLRQQITMGTITVPVFKLLQHGSTLIGIIFIAVVIMRLPKKISYSPKLRKGYWLIVLTILLLVMLGKYLMSNTISFGGGVVAAISGGFLGIFFASLTYNDNHQV